MSGAKHARRQPFAKAERWTAGWYAVAGKAGMCSGPWASEAEAQAVADTWNAATDPASI